MPPNAASADGDNVRIVGTPISLSDTPTTPGGPAPELGQHTEELLLEHGYSWDDIDGLRSTGAI